jgi:ParB family chromosome partitioning protein
MARRSGLGKGLDALIPGNQESETGSSILNIGVEKIQVNPLQPRQIMDDEGLADLAISIREYGILQPLVVTREPNADTYTLIAGERRLRAARLAGLETVPALVRLASDQQRLELALIENIQRTDLAPLETAEAYQRLSEEFGLSHEDIAARVGKSRVSVTNTLRLLKLPEVVRAALASGQISEGHARALLQLPTPQAQAAVLQTTVQQGLSVRQTEELARKYSGERAAKTPAAQVPPEIHALEERLRDRLGTRVTLTHGKRGGRLIIHYYSDEELDAIIQHLIQD